MQHHRSIAVELQNVQKEFLHHAGTPIRVLDDVTLAIPAGSICGVFGANGAGKSVLIKLIGGLLAPTAGRITLYGHNLRHARAEALRDVSLGIPEVQLRDPQQTVAQTLLQAEQQTTPSADDMRSHLNYHFQTGHLWEQREQVVATLSHGMQHRLAIACAIVGGPRLLLLDEPTQTLDALMTDMLAVYLRSLADSFGTTIVLTTSDATFAQMLCDDIALLHTGHVLTVQAVAALQAQYKTNVYQFRLQGHLDPQWQDWFDGLSITWEGQNTLIAGVLPDQTALHGMLIRMRDLNLPLLSVTTLNPDLHAIAEQLVHTSGRHTSLVRDSFVEYRTS